MPYKRWDGRVVRAYVEDGMREVPVTVPTSGGNGTEGGEGKGEGKGGVETKLTPHTESTSYHDPSGLTHSYHILPLLASRLPVHIVWGEVVDLIPREGKDQLTKHAKADGNGNGNGNGGLASTQYVKGVGHLLPQMAPKGAARALRASLLYPSNDREDERVKARARARAKL
jgi:hypothetical protein